MLHYSTHCASICKNLVFLTKANIYTKPRATPGISHYFSFKIAKTQLKKHWFLMRNSNIQKERGGSNGIFRQLQAAKIRYLSAYYGQIMSAKTY